MFGGRVVVVLGQYRSGSSAVAGVLKLMGGWDGERSVRPPNISNPTGFHEDFELDSICKTYFKIPEHIRTGDSQELVEKLRSWRSKQESLQPKDAKFICAKNPLFCLMTNELLLAWPDAAWICVRRDSNHSIKSIIDRGWDWPRENIDFSIQSMVNQRDKFLEQNYSHEVNYDLLISQPELEITNLANHIEVNLDRDTLKNAVKSIKPSLDRMSSRKNLFARFWRMIYVRILILVSSKRSRQ